MKSLKHNVLVSIAMICACSVNAQNSKIYLHKADSISISGHITTIDHEQLNNNVNYYPVFTHNFNPDGGKGIYLSAAMGTYYTGGKWKIYKEDKTALQKNTSFNVLLPGEETSSWVHTSEESNITNNYTIIDHPKFNGKPSINLFVSHMYNPGGGAGTYHNHNIGVFYLSTVKKWAVFNQDKEAMLEDISFNIVIPDASSDLEKFVHTVKASKLKTHISTIDNPSTNNNPNAKIIVTPLWNVDGSPSGVYNDHPIGVFYDGSKWAIYNEDLEEIPQNASFNVLIINDQTANIKNKIMELPSLRIGPNPVQQGQELTIGLYNENLDMLTVEMVDITGRIVYASKLDKNYVIIKHIPTVGLPKGVYSLTVSSNEVNSVRRIIIQ